ncbi:ABC transporter ATP-binding protein [Breznakiella homolactica]|uniref:ATP-binding cassette domain-containing protein n=1 Tax=Breznakiella homolactica TaxID=2798577 RepID=A0A7T7XLY9_9SPIR|nr:oligopeptide/dipeptide ABC transporter ATP-binding protein [Breznakiella homolactica]QQO08835.1 ATP-binding cassette domain-containing protein [Breznakiella homolactica]
MSTFLEVSNLKKHFKTPKGLLHAVDGVNFKIDEGKTLGVVGESGCGKSTLGRLIVHLHEITDGKIFFEGRDITNPPPKEMKILRKKMQMIFQDPYSSIDPRMTVFEIIGEPLKILNLYSNKEDYNKQIDQIMDIVGLAKRVRGAYPHELDGGRRQRIGIARALVLNPQFIVCDEPVSALDVSIQAQILNLMQDLQRDRNLTYMFITHDLSVVKHISDNIAVMYLGLIVEFCETKALFKAPAHPYTRALLSAIPIPSVHERRKRIILKGEISSPINPAECCRFAGRCIYAKERCQQEAPQLREVTPGHFCACHFAEEI